MKEPHDHSKFAPTGLVTIDATELYQMRFILDQVINATFGKEDAQRFIMVSFETQLHAIAHVSERIIKKMQEAGIADAYCQHPQCIESRKQEVQEVAKEFDPARGKYGGH